jgi:hypothetical protein
LKRTPVILLALILTMMCAAPLLSANASAATYAQSIVGTAHNETMAGFPDVLIRATNTTSLAVFNATTNSTGDYQLPLPSGTYNVTATLANYTANRAYTIVVTEGQDLSGVDFTLTEILGNVSGHVTDGVVALGDVQITLIGDSVNYTGMSATPFGDYAINGVEPGTYVVKASKLGYNDSYHFPAIVVDRGSQIQINFVLQAQFSMLLGKVTANGAAQENVNVALTQGSTVVKQTITDANGNYSITSVIAGDYILKFTRSGLQEKDVPLSIPPNREQRQDVTMELTPVEGLKGFIDDLDLTHSLMVVGFILALGMIGVAFVVASKGRKNPDILVVPEDEEKEEGQNRGRESGKKP